MALVRRTNQTGYSAASRFRSHDRPRFPTADEPAENAEGRRTEKGLRTSFLRYSRVLRASSPDSGLYFARLAGIIVVMSKPMPKSIPLDKVACRLVLGRDACFVPLNP